MDSSSTTCIFCGQERDLQRPTCPSCGRGWIDRRLPGASSAPWVSATPDASSRPDRGPDTAESELHPPAKAPAAKQSAAASSDTPTETDVPDDDGRRRRWPLLVAAVVLVAGAIGVAMALNGSDDSPPVAVVTTTVATTSEAPTTTTAAPTTTTSSSTTTTTSTTLPPLDPDGDPVPLEELTLGAFAIGPFAFGNAAVLPRLVATFDQPDEMVPAGATAGLCEGVDGIEVTWGAFTTVYTVDETEGDPADAVLVGYRLTEGAAGDETTGLSTLSGLQLGATVTELRDVYAGFEITVDEEGGSPRYVVVRTADDTTMLWGPLSAPDDTGVVEGIYSPLPCDGGAGT